MNVTRRTVTCLAAVVFCLAGLCHADIPTAKEWEGSDLGQVQFGQRWFGAPVEKDSLRGKVVVIEAWGYRCPPCISSLSHMAKYNAMLRNKPFVMIGAHAQGSSDDTRAEALDICRKKKVNFTVLSSALVPCGESQGIPHAMVFGPDGKLIWQGHPAEKGYQTMLSAIKHGLQNAMGDEKLWLRDRILEVLEPHPEARKTPAGRQILRGQFGSAWRMLEKLQDKDGEEAEQAKALLEALDTVAEEQLKQFEQFKASSPIEAEDRLGNLARLYRGCEKGKELKDRHNELKKDKSFREALMAERAYATLEQASWQVPPPPVESAQQRNWSRQYGRMAKQLVSKANQLKNRFPETPFAQQAEELVMLYSGEGSADRLEQ